MPDSESLVFREPLEDKTCFEGETISLECVIEGGKRLTKWYKGQSYKLTILHATREDEGVYTILIGNERKDVHLHVIERSPSLIQLRNYQQELADIALKGENTMICAGTNAGKTYVAFHVIESHLLKNPRASPGTNKAKDLAAAKDHLRKVMANLDVSKLSLVQRNREELLQYTSIPEKVSITSTTRQHDPLKDILLKAMEYVEQKFNCRIVSNFLTENLHESREVYAALGNPPLQRTEVRYIQWIAETKEKVEHVLDKDRKVPRLLHACLSHLELYTECLELNSLLEIDQVREVIMQGYADLSHASQNANTDEEREIVSKLRDVIADIREIGRNIEGNPDIQTVIGRIESEHQQLEEDSRFIIFVKTRATAKALAERLPDYLRSTYLTGSHKSAEEGGRSPDEQIEVLEKFRNGEHLCIVATSVGCEGIDVPQCNMMIRYRFSPDEISSLQMRGRVRRKEGHEVIVGTTKEFETEKKNIQRQYLMVQAIQEVSLLNIARDITIAEKNIYETEEIERRTERIKTSEKQIGLFSVNCKYCGVIITDGNRMRTVNERMFFVCDKTILGRVDKRSIAKKKQREFDGCKKQGKAYGLECGHNWGSIIIYKECDFVALSQDYIKIFDRQSNKFIDCDKWCDLKFKIEEMSDDDFISYNTQIA
ncbi:DDX58 [Mytilus coruscus]|uniref:RNA helicase n=1 Tax=Mytilus coruscus TaxID=42192 RepID=A0A6J8CQ40_MYTCO|nr:DDX58 [Mytilus coruscus]